MHNRGATVRRTAPAKINLGLHVLRRRGDGFHDIETVMVPVGWHDVLSYEPAGSFTFTCSDPSLPNDFGNLSARAAQMLADRAGVPLSGALHLDKRLPHGAGLGGGSSDAAATLRLLAHSWNLEIPDEDLHQMAAILGSDVPFFLYDRPLLARGRGEQLAEISAHEPYRLPFSVAVVMPPVHVSTGEAYGLVRPSSLSRADLREVVLSNDLQRWRRELSNDFERPLLERHPEILAARSLLLEQGAGYAALTGSGAAVFGIFERGADAASAAAAAGSRSYTTWWGSALDSSTSPRPAAESWQFRC